MMRRPGDELLRPDDKVLREVCDPLPAPVAQAWRAWDRLQEQILWLQRHPPRVEVAETQFGRDYLEAALRDGEPVWPSAEGVLDARRALEAHKASELAVCGARQGAEQTLSQCIVRYERQLVESLDDKLCELQHRAGLRKAAHAVPLGVGGDGLLAAGPDTASQAAQLGKAAGDLDRIKAARRVIFEHVHPQRAPWIAIVAEGAEDGLIWKSQFVRGEDEKPPWTGGPGGELHFAITAGIRLRCMTAAQLDQAGYDPPGIVLQTSGMR
jgi:hypothetical protein